MAKNKISDLQNHLFETIEKLLDKEDSIEVEKAEAIVKVSNAIVETAKLQLQYVKMKSDAEGIPDNIYVLENTEPKRIEANEAEKKKN